MCVLVSAGRWRLCVVQQQVYANALEYVQQWILRYPSNADALMEYFDMQQKLFGNVAWCM